MIFAIFVIVWSLINAAVTGSLIRAIMVAKREGIGKSDSVPSI